jgi:amidase
MSSALWDLATPDFKAPLQEVLRKASAALHTTPEDISLTGPDETFEQWRLAYVAHGAYEAWQLHGDWIKENQPTFSPAIAGRWLAAQNLSAGQAELAMQHTAKIRQHIRSILGDDAILILPSAAGIAPLHHATGADVDALRMRTMHITCIAGIAGVCQVNIPYFNDEGLPVGVSLMGPAGSDLALVRLATAIAAMPSQQT